MLTIAAVIILEPVPPRDRIEMLATGVLEPLFPVEDLRVRVNGSTIPKSHVEVSPKNVGTGMLTIVNKTVREWPGNATVEAYLP